MKRALPLLLIVSALEIYGIISAGNWLFKDRFVDPSEITVLKEGKTNSGLNVVLFQLNGKEYKACNIYDYKHTKSKTLRYEYSDTYAGLTVFYLVFVVCFGVHFIIKTIDFFVIYDSDYEAGGRFRSYASIFPDCYSDLYNSIDSYDLTPLKDKFKSFWGY